MPRTFNLELLNTHLAKDSAKLVREYDKLTQTSKITFLCSCNTEVTKEFKGGVNYGFRCSDCKKVAQNAKRKENYESKSTVYTLDLLNECAKRDNAIIEGEYIPLNIATSIKYTCSCGTKHCKTFKYIKDLGMFCKSCSAKKRVEKAAKTNLERYGSTCTLQSESIKAKAEETLLERFGTTNIFTVESVRKKIASTNLIKYGAENPYASKKIIEKIRKTCKEKYGTEFPNKTKEVQEKRKLTTMEKYGVEVSSQADCVKQKARETNLLIYGSEHHIIPKILEKGKKTNMERYGVEYTFQSDQVKKKIKETMLERYGVDHNMKSELIKEKARNTNIRKLGVPNALQSPIIREKIKNTCLTKYGVKSPTQSTLIQSKIQKSGFNYRNYTCPSGAIRKIQGYEHYALDILFKTDNIAESEDHTDRCVVPRIEYKMNNKTHYYFPDIWVPSQNKLIEVKSDWTYALHKERNLKKQVACKSAGYNFEFWVFDAQGNHTIM